MSHKSYIHIPGHTTSRTTRRGQAVYVKLKGTRVPMASSHLDRELGYGFSWAFEFKVHTGFGFAAIVAQQTAAMLR